MQRKRTSKQAALLVLAAIAILLGGAGAEALAANEVTVLSRGYGGVRNSQQAECLSPATTPATSDVACGKYGLDNCWESPDRTIAQCQVTLIARVASDGWRFDGWEGGGCEGAGQGCTVVISRTTCDFDIKPPCETEHFTPTVIAKFKDVRAPAITLSGHDGEMVVDPNRQRSLSWSTIDPQEGPTFACWLDGGAIPCANTLSGLADGNHTFTIRATDPSGNQATAGRVWNQQVPLQLSLSTPSPGRTATFTFGSNKASGVAYHCRLERQNPDSTWTQIASDGACGSPKTYSNLQVRPHRLTVTGTLGSMTAVETRSWTVVDSDAPSITVTQAPPDGGVVVSDSRQQRFQVTTDEPATFQCRLDNAAPATCDPVAGHTVANLADGMHTFGVVATDTAGNARELQFAWEQQAPARATLTDGPAEGKPSSDKQARFGFTTAKTGVPVSYQCRLDESGPWTGCSSPRQLSELNDGTHVFEVQALFQDHKGTYHAGPAVARSWSVDTAPPETLIKRGPAENALSSETAVQFQLEAEPDARFECSLDQQPFAPCTNTPTFTGIQPGTHRLEARAIDSAGNTDPTPAARTWRATVDADGDGSLAGTDCDDGNPAIHPGARDTPGDLVDQDCLDGPASWERSATQVRLTTSWKGRASRVGYLRITEVKVGTTATVTCKGRGCPFKSERATATRAGTLTLTKLFKRRWLPAGTEIVVSVSRPDAITPVVTYTTRVKKVPKRIDRCLAPGAKAAAAC